MANIKECFVSRFGDDGVIMECDYSQLEVIGAAEISGDRNMIADIVDGVDSHSQSASWLNPKHTYQEILDGYNAEDTYFTKLRKNAKAPRFQLQYGAGANSIAQSNNLTVATAKEFIERYYSRYRELKNYQDYVAETVEQNAVKVGRKTINGHDVPIMGGVFRGVTGRGYYFEQDTSPDFMREKGVLVSFSPTKFKNYPVQGFATGDIVPEMLGRIMRVLFQEDWLYDKCIPINTVHDSIIFDVHKSCLPASAILIKETMEDVHGAMKDRFNLNLSLPFKVDVEAGPNWYDIKKVVL